MMRAVMELYETFPEEHRFCEDDILRMKAEVETYRRLGTERCRNVPLKAVSERGRGNFATPNIEEDDDANGGKNDANGPGQNSNDVFPSDTSCSYTPL